VRIKSRTVQNIKIKYSEIANIIVLKLKLNFKHQQYLSCASITC